MCPARKLITIGCAQQEVRTYIRKALDGGHGTVDRAGRAVPVPDSVTDLGGGEHRSHEHERRLPTHPKGIHSQNTQTKKGAERRGTMLSGDREARVFLYDVQHGGSRREPG